jgi:alpha-N-arabinofuranosidase
MKTVLLLLSVIVALSSLACQGPQAQSDATISIDVAHPGPAFSPTMYGVFFEDINHAADGGLYAELIQNRDFEYNRVPEDMRWKDDSTIVNQHGWIERYRKPDELFAWSLVQEGGASARISLERSNPVNAANSQSLRLDVRSLGTGRAGVANGGYWGVPVRKGVQ